MEGVEIMKIIDWFCKQAKTKPLSLSLLMAMLVILVGAIINLILRFAE